MDVAGLRPEASGSERGSGGAPAACLPTAAVTSSPMVRSVKMDLAVGESAGTSSPRLSGGENDEAKKFEEASFIDGVLQGPQAEKDKAVLDEVYFLKGLGLDVGEEDLDTGYSVKGFGQLGLDVGVRRSKDKLDKVSREEGCGLWTRSVSRVAQA